MTNNLNFIIELRKRMLHCLTAIAIVAIPLTYFANSLYGMLAKPLIQQLTGNKHLIATAVASPLIVPLKFAVILAVYIAIPVILYQLWNFVAPALYKHEKKLIWPLLIMSTVLFYLGMCFAYFIVFPLIFKFFIATAPTEVTVMPDMNEYLNFALKLLFAFGVAFEVPIITLLLIKTGLVTRETLKEKRPFVIVGAFVVGMLLTPPDVLSQIMLAIPIWFLFELGLVLSTLFIRESSTEAQKRNV